MVELFEFTFNGACLKAIVNAYRQLQLPEFVFHFTREDVTTSVLGPSRVRMIQISLTPFDYRAHTDEAWVRGGMDLLWGAVKNLRKKDDVKVRVEDGKFYVGTVQPGVVVPEDEIFDEEKFKPPTLEDAGSLYVIVSDLRRILKAGLPGMRYVGFDIDEPGGRLILLNAKHSIIDLERHFDWLLRVRGKARAGYDLESFAPLLVSGLSEYAEIKITEKDPAIIEYDEEEYRLKFYIAPVINVGERIAEILAAPRPLREEILNLEEPEVKALARALRAIDYVNPFDIVKMAPVDGLALYWNNGYLKIPSVHLATWSPPAKPIAGSFYVTELVKHLRDVEDLRLCFEEVEGESKLVLMAEGAKIAPRELEAYESLEEIDLPEVMGKEVFTGPTDLVRRTIEDAKIAEDHYVIFYTTPYVIEALGKNAVHYSASFETNDFRVVTEDYVPVGGDAFDSLIGFLRQVPGEWCTVGGAEEDDIYLRCETEIGELRVIYSQEPHQVEEAVEAYEEAMKPPAIPLEAEKLPEVPALPPVMKTYAQLEEELEGKNTYDILSTLVSRHTGFQRDYREEDLRRFWGELRKRVTPWDIQQFYKIYPNLEEDFKSVARSMGWAPPPPPPAVASPTPPPEEPSLGELYLKYYAETQERHRAEAAAEEVRTVSRIEEHEAEVPHEEENEVIEEVPAEVHIEEVAEPEEEEAEEPSMGDLYLEYYKEARARHTEKT